MISLGIDRCRCVVRVLVSRDLNVGCLAGDPVALRMW